jgi:two-component system, NarL family, sensor histidine kinase DegS
VKPQAAVAGVLALGVTGALAGTRLRKRQDARSRGARELAQRVMREESQMRRHVAEAIHDGPIQELIALDMVLATASQALNRGDTERGAELLGEAREGAARNVRLLREELVELGPYAFEEANYEISVERCLPIWKRRYGLDVRVTIERIALAPEMAGELFRITQEAVINAGRHAEAETVAVSLRTVDGKIELRVVDDGEGIEGAPLEDPVAGHLGLMSIRERAELLGGSLELESSDRGTKLVVRVPAPA